MCGRYPGCSMFLSCKFHFGDVSSQAYPSRNPNRRLLLRTFLLRGLYHAVISWDITGICNAVVFRCLPLPMPMIDSRSSTFWDAFISPKTIGCPCPYPLIRVQRGRWHLVEGGLLIPEVTRLAAWSVRDTGIATSLRYLFT